MCISLGCNFTPPVKYQIENYQLDMPVVNLKKSADWQSDSTGWDLVSEGTLCGTPGTYRVNFHDQQVVEVHFSVTASDELPTTELQQQAEHILKSITQQYGNPTFKRVRLYEMHSDDSDPDRPYADRIEWRDRDYRMAIGIREDSFDVTIDNTHAESLRAIDRQQR